MTRAEKVISALGYAGLCPFVLACGLQYAGEEALASQLFLSYSAIILSFLGGTHWGRLLSSGKALELGAGLFALVASNVFALLAWSALLLSHGNILYPFIILTAGFVLLFLVETASIATIATIATVDSAVHSRYSAFRAFLTISVLLLHGVFLLLSVQ
jgi:hypothetical protein